MYKIGLSTSGKPLDDEFFKNCAEAGISCMEISKNSEFYDLPDYSHVKKLADTYGIELWSFHLPFKPWDSIDISASDTARRKKSIAYIAEIIKKAVDIGIDKYILHSGGCVKMIESNGAKVRASEKEAAERLKCACESYAEFAEIAAKEGGVICVENLPPLCVGKDISEIKTLVASDERLRVCFDTNHLLPGDAAEFIEALKDRLITLHVSDYDFVDERHWLPGEGKINWQRVYSALKAIDYRGPWMYEVSFRNSSAITRERELTCEDLVKNANEIFDNKPFTLIPSKITL